MKLRIISGTLRGRMLNLDDKKLSFRPTLERTRQSLADSLQPRIFGARMVDLCAGSGAFGFEMLSRGAHHVTFIEKDAYCIQSIRLYAEKFGVTPQCTIVKQDVREFLKMAKVGYDLVYFDPPYDNADLPLILPGLIGCLSGSGVLLYERRKNTPGVAMDNPVGTLIETKVFGETAVDFYTGTAQE